MKKMDPMELVDIRSTSEFERFYNHNIAIVDKVLNKLIVANNRQNKQIFNLSLMVFGLGAAVYALASRQAKLEDKFNALQSEKETSKDEEK